MLQCVEFLIHYAWIESRLRSKWNGQDKHWNNAWPAGPERIYPLSAMHLEDGAVMLIDDDRFYQMLIPRKMLDRAIKDDLLQ